MVVSCVPLFSSSLFPFLSFPPHRPCRPAYLFGRSPHASCPAAEAPSAEAHPLCSSIQFKSPRWGRIHLLSSNLLPNGADLVQACRERACRPCSAGKGACAPERGECLRFARGGRSPKPSAAAAALCTASLSCQSTLRLITSLLCALRRGNRPPAAAFNAPHPHAPTHPRTPTHRAPRRHPARPVPPCGRRRRRRVRVRPPVLQAGET